MNDGRQWHLLPGTLCTSAVFDELLNILKVPHANRHSIELSKPDVRDYRHYFKTAIGDDDIICGFSLGAIVAAHHADILAENTTLLLFGVNPMADDPSKADGRAALCKDVQKFGGRHALEKRLKGQDTRMTQANFELILRMSDDAAHLIEAQTQLALSRPGALEALAKAKGPVHAMTGDSDDQVQPDFAKRVASIAPIGRYQLLPNLMHYALLENPDQCAQAVAKALSVTSQLEISPHD